MRKNDTEADRVRGHELRSVRNCDECANATKKMNLKYKKNTHTLLADKLL